MDILASLSTLHSIWRYAVLIAAVLAIVVAVGAWLGPLHTRLFLQPVVRRAAVLYVAVLDLQALLGIVLWLGKGGLALPPPYRLEHPVTMLLAVVVVHAGQVMARRAHLPLRAARAVAVAAMLSLVLVILGIPGLIRGG